MPKRSSVPFDIEADIAGVRVIVTKQPLSSACKSELEVDYAIDALQEQIERLRTLMKSALKDLRESPLGLHVSTDL